MTEPFRQEVKESDPEAVFALVKSTNVFSADEQVLARELVEETIERGAESGYQFLFLDDEEGGLIGYACFGKIPATRSSFDLYWIAVAPAEQGKGLGFELLRESERIALRQGATRMYIDTSGRLRYAPTREFYARCDYSRAAVFEDFYAHGDAKIVYCRVLSDDSP
jgi:D-alanine-D-alanine ligase